MIHVCNHNFSKIMYVADCIDSFMTSQKIIGLKTPFIMLNSISAQKLLNLSDAIFRKDNYFAKNIN